MLKRFFWICSGADVKLLETCPGSEKEKYAGVGATVFFTAVMAFIAAAYALYTVFENAVWAVIFGMVWGFLIFNLDRYIVSTIRKRGKLTSNLVQVLPRAALAIVIALVISKPLELKLFEKEIEALLLSEKNALTEKNSEEITAQYAAEVGRLEKENAARRQEITDKQSAVDASYRAFITEAEGTAGTGKVGKGPVYAEKREKHDALQGELKDLREGNTAAVATNVAKLDEIRAKMEIEKAESAPVIDRFDGLMARLSVMDQLPLLPRLFIMLLFMLIELAPVMAKLLTPDGPYDFKLNELEEGVPSDITAALARRKTMQTADASIDQRVYESLRGEDELYLSRKQRARVYLQNRDEKFYAT